MSDKVLVFQGKPGTSNVDGIDGLGVGDVQIDKLESPVFDVLCTNILSRAGNIEFDRGSLASHVNRHHKNVWSREDDITNYAIFSEDFTQWDDNIFDSWDLIGSTTDPFGGSLATEINLNIDTDTSGGDEIIFETVPGPISTSINLTLSFWIKIISGEISELEILVDNEKHIMAAPTSTYQRVSKIVSINNASFTLSINPRGKTGARLALFGVQLENNNVPSTYIKTTSTSQSVTFNGELERESDEGWLIEEQKENVIRYSNDLLKWSKTNVDITSSASGDPFDVIGQNILFVWSTVDEVSISTTTASLTPSTAYTVSFWAHISAGSLSSLTVSLGGGAAVTMPQVDVSGFVRISVTVISGSGTGLVITAISPNLTANLNISGVQAEIGTLTSYIATAAVERSRLADVVTGDVPFNIPRPDKTWSFIFRHKSILNNSAKKFIFTNNETGSTEFSCYFTDADLTLKNGTSETTVSALSIEKIAITFSGSTLKIYNESTLIISTSIASTSFLADTLYIGMNSAKNNAINARISNFMFYDVELTSNEIIYLMGA